MSYLMDSLEEAGLSEVKTYIQSATLIWESDLSDHTLNQLIDVTIKD
ncbi:DUF1697 domain-containing protein [Streptococcus sp. AN2]|nr:DUF1697 domain-containing protein [Streptococcus sp. AN2]